MAETYEIEMGVPMPHPKALGLVGALRRLSAGPVGCSILINGKNGDVVRASVAAAAGRGWAATRKVEGGLRVWKIAEPKRPAAQAEAA